MTSRNPIGICVLDRPLAHAAPARPPLGAARSTSRTRFRNFHRLARAANYDQALDALSPHYACLDVDDSAGPSRCRWTRRGCGFES
jgi:hypothetical protein